MLPEGMMANAMQHIATLGHVLRFTRHGSSSEPWHASVHSLLNSRNAVMHSNLVQSTTLILGEVPSIPGRRFQAWKEPRAAVSTSKRVE